MNDYEAQRLENLAQKQRLLSELNLNSATVGRRRAKTDSDSRTATKKRKITVESRPSRTSARIASTTSRPSYNEDVGEKYHLVERKNRKAKGGAKGEVIQSLDVEHEPRSMVPSKDAEELRAGWSQWTPTGPAPTRDEEGTLHFSDYPTFAPNKSPEEMIREGCFGGSYWRPLKSRKLGIVVEEDWEELPEGWYEGLDVGKYMISPGYDADANKFKVSCGQSIEEWEAAGWISFEHDIRGWFQWYCRFFQGRRCEDDERQVGRWARCVGPTGRWRRMLLKRYVRAGVRDVFDDGGDEDGIEVSPVMHQTCHHWAFEVRQGVLDAFWRNGR